MTYEGNITDAMGDAIPAEFWEAARAAAPTAPRYHRNIARALLAASRVHPAGEPVAATAKMTTVRAHKPTCANVQAGSTVEDKCDCGALDTAGEAIPLYASPAPSYADAIRDAVKVLRKIIDSYVEEHGTYDPETGATEFPGNGDEYVAGLEEQIEAIEALTPGSPL